VHYLLFYDYVPDYLERREALRGDHLALAWQAQGRGELVLGGVLTDTMDTGILLFQADAPEVVEAFVAADPYVQKGLVTRWTVRPWHTVVGASATHPVRP
jgi:uncharacterized protein YciI